MKVIKQLIFSALAVLFSCTSDTPSINCTSSGPTLTVSKTVTPSCSNLGLIEVIASEGQSPYNYSIDSINFKSTGKFSNLTGGDYQVYVSDANECSATVSVTLTTQSDLKVTYDATNSPCGTSTGTLTITATGGDGHYQFSIDNGNYQTQNTFSKLVSGKHLINVKDESCDTSFYGRVYSGISYEKDVQSIIVSNCATSGCHNGVQKPNLLVFDNVKTYAASIENRVTKKTMPPSYKTPLTSDQIQTIVCWVDDGAQNN